MRYGSDVLQGGGIGHDMTLLWFPRSMWVIKAGKMLANMSIFHVGRFPGKYWQILENSGKYWSIELASLEFIQ